MAREPPVLSEIPVDLVGATLAVARAAQAYGKEPPGRGADMPAPVIASQRDAREVFCRALPARQNSLDRDAILACQCSHWRGNPSLPAAGVFFRAFQKNTDCHDQFANWSRNDNDWVCCEAIDACAM